MVQKKEEKDEGRIKLRKILIKVKCDRCNGTVSDDNDAVADNDADVSNAAVTDADACPVSVFGTEARLA